MTYKTEIQIWWKNITISISKITNDINLDNISRVYVIAYNDDWNIWLIYNSKRNIRWFPWWHKEPNETILDVANREYIEEIWYDLSSCTMAYLVENQIDSDQIEKQIICFGKIGNINTSHIEAEESVTEVGFFPFNQTIEKIWNKWLREKIMMDFFQTYGLY